MMFAAVVGQPREIVRRETIYRNRNAVQTNPATSQCRKGPAPLRACEPVIPNQYEPHPEPIADTEVGP